MSARFIRLTHIKHVHLLNNPTCQWKQTDSAELIQPVERQHAGHPPLRKERQTHTSPSSLPITPAPPSTAVQPNANMAVCPNSRPTRNGTWLPGILPTFPRRQRTYPRLTRVTQYRAPSLIGLALDRQHEVGAGMARRTLRVPPLLHGARRWSLGSYSRGSGLICVRPSWDSVHEMVCRRKVSCGIGEQAMFLIRTPGRDDEHPPLLLGQGDVPSLTVFCVSPSLVIGFAMAVCPGLVRDLRFVVPLGRPGWAAAGGAWWVMNLVPLW